MLGFMTNPLLGSLDPNEFDRSFRPQDDLYRFVNGRWLESHQIPADRAIDGVFYTLRDRSEAQVRVIIEDCVAGKVSGDLAGKVAALYGDFMDESKVEDEAPAVLQGLRSGVEAVADKAALRDLWARTWTEGVYEGWFDMGVDVDLNNPEAYVNYFAQDGIGLPERAYYLEEKHAEILAEYRAHVARMLELAGYVEDRAAGERVAGQIVDFETAVAQLQWDNVKTRDTDATNNPMSFADFAALMPHFDLGAWRRASGLPDKMFDQVNVGEPDFFSGMDALWEATDLEVLRWWMLWGALNSHAALLSAQIVQADFEFYGMKLAGKEEQRERWKRGVGLASSVMGEALGELYVQRHFPAQAKVAMESLVANLIAAYRESISRLEWMGVQTREKALEKLALFTPKIGYPDRWRDYSKLNLSPSQVPRLVDKVRAASSFASWFWIDKLGGPVDKTIWHMTPQTVNAYYNPTVNEIVFPAAILQPPFFDPAADPAVNYGAIGAVIGHEIGHGFDDQGSKFDGHGQVNDWWTGEDSAEFQRRTQALIAQYDAFVPQGLSAEFHVNGALTIGENIGDLGGLDIAWKAYCLHLRAQGISDPAQAPVIEGLSAAQRFLLSWARSWQSKSRPEFAKQMISIDPHSPSEFRCNGVVANLDLFAQTFQTAPGDKLWLEPTQRVRIW